MNREEWRQSLKVAQRAGQVELLRMIESGMSHAEIGRELGISRQAVYLRLQGAAGYEKAVRKRTPKRKCEACGKQFTPKRVWMRFCSQPCQKGEWQREMARARKGDK